MKKRKCSKNMIKNHSYYWLILWDKKIQTQKWCIAEKFWPQKLGVTKSFFTLKVVSNLDFDHFLEKWLQCHLILVLSWQKFSSWLTQWSSIVSKTYSKFQGEFVDSFFLFKWGVRILRKKGSINNYVNKWRWVGGQSNVYYYKVKCLSLFTTFVY